MGGFLLDQFEGVHHPVERVPVSPRPADCSRTVRGGGGEYDHGEPLLVDGGGTAKRWENGVVDEFVAGARSGAAT